MKNKHKIVIILQARMGSTRLPGKVLLPFGGTTLLGWIVLRLRSLSWPVIVATSMEEHDLAIYQFCKEQGMECFRGNETDVLDRYHACLKLYDFDHVIRLTADNPFTDIEELQHLADFHLQGRYDYSHSFGQLPVGVGAEIFSAKALSVSWLEGHKQHHREHVNEFVLENPQLFRIGKLKIPEFKQCRELHLTIDTDSDYQQILQYIDDSKSSTQITTEQLIKKCSFSA